MLKFKKSAWETYWKEKWHVVEKTPYELSELKDSYKLEETITRETIAIGVSDR